MGLTATGVGSKLEVLDLLWHTDPAGTRVPISRSDALARLASSHQPAAARMVSRLPHHDDVIHEHAIDQLFLAVHFELARLSEHLHVPRLISDALRPLIAQVRARAGGGTVRIVDVGCGVGLDMRYIAAHHLLGDDVELFGLDLNSLLIDAAAALAHAERVPVEFVVGNAFDATAVVHAPERTVMISQGVLHHLGSDRLPDFFAHHAALGIGGFAHFDVNPGFWSTFGGWVLHQARMRHPVSRHDGTMSMRRAFTAPALLEYARAGAHDAYHLSCDTTSALIPLPHRALRPIVGVLQ